MECSSRRSLLVVRMGFHDAVLLKLQPRHTVDSRQSVHHLQNLLIPQQIGQTSHSLLVRPCGHHNVNVSEQIYVGVHQLINILLNVVLLAVAKSFGPKSEEQKSVRAPQTSPVVPAIGAASSLAQHPPSTVKIM